MTWANPNTPNIPDYTLFLADGVGIDPVYLPPSSPFIGYAFNQAMGLVINIPTLNSGIDYTRAVYNCAAHIQMEITPDQQVSGVPYTFFKDSRKVYDLLLPTSGLVQSTSDEGTSTTFAVPDALAQLTLHDLDFMKTPWGRRYLAFLQAFGGIWGLS